MQSWSSNFLSRLWHFNGEWKQNPLASNLKPESLRPVCQLHLHTALPSSTQISQTLNLTDCFPWPCSTDAQWLYSPVSLFLESDHRSIWKFLPPFHIQISIYTLWLPRLIYFMKLYFLLNIFTEKRNFVHLILIEGLSFWKFYLCPCLLSITRLWVPRGTWQWYTYSPLFHIRFSLLGKVTE